MKPAQSKNVVKGESSIIANNLLKVIAVGDTTLMSKDGKYPFQNIEHLFTSKDVAFANLEVVLTKRGVPLKKRTVLRTNPENVNFLCKIGFDIVNIANNHIFDYGIEGYRDTLNALEKTNLKYIGALEKDKNIPCIIEKNGIRLGFLAYIHPTEKLEHIVRDIINLKKEVNVVIISFHWGVEYTFYPMPIQQKIARRLIDCGADVILGHHPHVIQGIENYAKGLIVYSLGNFQFAPTKIGNMCAFEYANVGLVVELGFSKEGLESYQIIPIKIGGNYEPNEMNGKEKEEFLRFLNVISTQSKGNQISEKQWFEMSAEAYIRSAAEAWFFRIKKYGFLHFLQFVFWLMQPFTIKMIMGFVRKKIRLEDTIGRNNIRFLTGDSSS